MGTIHAGLGLPPVSSKEAAWAVEDIEAPLGAVVSGIDASQPLNAAQIMAMRQALRDRHILLLRGQQLDDAQFLRLASYFGGIYRPPMGEEVLGYDPYTGTIPDIVSVSNFDGGVLGRNVLAPHTDHHWTTVPSSGSMAHAVHIPSTGGDTTFTDLAAAYDTLDHTTRREIDGLQLITYSPFLRFRKPQGARGIPKYRTPDIEPVLPGVIHPLVRTHPESGRRLIYLSVDTEVEVVGMEAARGMALIERLRTHVQQPQFAYTHRWLVGDIVYRDNMATLHARSAFPPGERRLLRRISFAGSRPF